MPKAKKIGDKVVMQGTMADLLGVEARAARAEAEREQLEKVFKYLVLRLVETHLAADTVKGLVIDAANYTQGEDEFPTRPPLNAFVQQLYDIHVMPGVRRERDKVANAPRR
jgi:hypothetical protein